MKSTLVFKTRSGSCYLYDKKKSYLLNIHPLIETINEMDADNSMDLVIEKLKSLYPHMSYLDIEYYTRKYGFLKSCGFFEKDDMNGSFSGRITPEIVKSQIANLDHVLFQVTGDCNLRCRYCCYGDLYNETTNRKPMDFETAQTLLNYLILYWNSSQNMSYKHSIRIGFYGGEPLVNFRLIRQIVSFCDTIALTNNLEFTYGMTTNALLLNKYVDYLVEHDFSLLISLDGNEEHDSLRVDINGNPSFKRVFNNLKHLQRDYPRYFEKNIQFNSVLNKHSSVEEIHNYINKEFGKIPMIESISRTGLSEDMMPEYDLYFQPYIESKDMITKRREKSPFFKELGFFFYYQLNNSFKHYCEVMYGVIKQKKTIPTGTCLPFFKKMFITSDGKLLVCERIPLQNVLGNVKEDVNLNFDQISELYNSYYMSMEDQCNTCYIADNCGDCLLQFPMKEGKPVCPRRMDKRNYQQYLAELFYRLEKNPELFYGINNIVFA